MKFIILFTVDKHSFHRPVRTMTYVKVSAQVQQWQWAWRRQCLSKNTARPRELDKATSSTQTIIIIIIILLTVKWRYNCPCVRHEGMGGMEVQLPLIRKLSSQLHSMKLIPLWNAKSRSATQEVSRLLWHQQFRFLFLSRSSTLVKSKVKVFRDRPRWPKGFRVD